MKNIFILLITIVGFFSCGNANEEQVSTDNNATPVQVAKKTPTPDKKVEKEKILCQINGKDWSYTKASGIISTYRKTKQRTALITFKKKLKKGSESIQLEYDANTFELIKTSLQLKFEGQEGKLFTCFYTVGSQNKNRHPQNKMSGTIDLSNKSLASGTAESSNINIRFEKGKLSNPEDATVTISNLKFSDIGYSDTDKFAKAYKK